ncbi:MAG: hypothetical protein ABI361_09520 [Nitrososphaera sp.]|jgi:hypothetical protein
MATQSVKRKLEEMFEENNEILRQNTAILKENQAIMKENNRLMANVDEKLRKIIINTSSR